MTRGRGVARPGARSRALLAAACWAALALACGRDAPPDLLFVSLDTTRPDRMGAYGYPRPTTPAFDALAREGALFENAYSQAVHTSPSHLTMMTGLRPHTHGVVLNGMHLDAPVPTLARILSDAGYTTAGFVSGFPLRPRLSDVAQGFDVYDARFGPERRRPGAQTVDRALAWLGRQRPAWRRWLAPVLPRRPVFLFVHLYDAHGRYHSSPELEALFRSSEPGPRLETVPDYQERRDEGGEPVLELQEYLDAYDAALRYQDDQLARLVAALDPGHTIVVVVADHGETLGERHHKLDHGAQLFEEAVRIPLVVRVPEGRPQRIDAVVETTDLLPTLLDLLGLPAPPDAPDLEGRSLAGLVRAGTGAGRDAVVSVAEPGQEPHADRGYRLDADGLIVSLVLGAHPRWKLIRYPGVDGDIDELYDLEADPGERSNVAAARPDELARARERLAREVPDGARLRRGDIDPEQEAQLRALGYFQ